jgi:hypothetical protein
VTADQAVVIIGRSIEINAPEADFVPADELEVPELIGVCRR